jgi:hypothetical protein
MPRSYKKIGRQKFFNQSETPVAQEEDETKKITLWRKWITEGLLCSGESVKVGKGSSAGAISQIKVGIWGQVSLGAE